MSCFVLVALLHLLGATVYAINYIQFTFTNETRNSFLQRTISQYGAVVGANKILSLSDKVLVTSRQLVYYINSEVFYASAGQQANIEIRMHVSDAKILWKQLNQQNITHILVPFDLLIQPSPSAYIADIHKLYDKNCLDILGRFEAVLRTSKTLSMMGISKSKFSLVKLKPNMCDYAVY